MTVKILINNLGQHTIADVRQVSDKETEEILAYWVKEPRTISYRKAAEGEGVSVDFMSPCPVAVTTEYAVRADSIVSILDPVPQILEKYVEIVNAVPAEAAAEEAPAAEEAAE